MRRGMAEREIGHLLRGEEGSALVMAVIAMVVLGILVLSFAALGDLEVRMGFNQVLETQALHLADAGIEDGRFLIRNDNSAALTARFVSGLFSNKALGSVGSYTVTIANDCNSTFSWIPVAQQDSGCGTNQDTNLKAVLTSTGTTAAGGGQAVVRAMVAENDLWKHVCVSDDDPCYSTTGNPTITPEDPSDPNGPFTFTPIPSPTTGPGIDGTPNVILPYYDIAVTTSCPASVCNPAREAWSAVACPTCKGLVFTGNTTIKPNGPIPGGGDFVNTQPNPLTFGTQAAPVVIYVMGTARLQINVVINGTLVSHGDTNVGTTDLDIAGQATLGFPLAGLLGGCPGGPNSCGYPLALLLYNPALPPPPQNISANISNVNATINGFIYSGGSVTFNPIIVNGGVVASNVDFQGSSVITYTPNYSNGMPPPGFGFSPTGQKFLIVRGSWYPQ